jgi:hypothetical protein
MDTLNYALNRRPFRDRLMAVPAVSEVMEDILLKEKSNDVKFFSKKILENFNIPGTVARLAIVELRGIRQED